MSKPLSSCKEPSKENSLIASSNQASLPPHLPPQLDPYVDVILQENQDTNLTPPPPPPSPTRERLEESLCASIRGRALLADKAQHKQVAVDAARTPMGCFKSEPARWVAMPESSSCSIVCSLDRLRFSLLLLVNVLDCRVCGHPHSRLRFAFVEFADENSSRATLNLSGIMLGFSQVKVLPSKITILLMNPTFLPRVSQAEFKIFLKQDVARSLGPSRLLDLKMMVEEGFLVSDHFIKHLDSQRWLVSPPEAPGILLVEVGELVPASNQTDEEVLPVSVETNDDSEPKEDLGIDERVATLFDVFTSIPGKELETLAEVLQITFDNGDLQRWGHSEKELIRQWV
ncbi:hypothetical protein Tco_0666450 [Tanacetum coccineum]